jgi:hypothetical protein
MQAADTALRLHGGSMSTKMLLNTIRAVEDSLIAFAADLRFLGSLSGYDNDRTVFSFSADFFHDRFGALHGAFIRKPHGVFAGIAEVSTDYFLNGRMTDRLVINDAETGAAAMMAEDNAYPMPMGTAR